MLNFHIFVQNEHFHARFSSFILSGAPLWLLFIDFFDLFWLVVGWDVASSSNYLLFSYRRVSTDWDRIFFMSNITRVFSYPAATSVPSQDQLMSVISVIVSPTMLTSWVGSFGSLSKHLIIFYSLIDHMKISEFYPPTASSWLSGDRPREIIGQSCRRVTTHSAWDFAMLNTLTV